MNVTMPPYIGLSHSERNNPLVCSSLARSARDARAPVACPYCQCVFRPWRHDQKYCHAKCGNSYRTGQRNKRARYVLRYMERHAPLALAKIVSRLGL
jgi:predicted amidophosphoribosyltransferase